MGRHSVPVEVPASPSGRFRQRTRSGFTGIFLYVMPVLVFAGSIALGAFGVAALQAALGHGTSGYFIARTYGCVSGRYGQQRCGWSGEFELADGKVIGTAFGYQGTDPGMHAGTKVAALDPSGSLDTAFPRQWTWGWLFDLLLALVGCAGSGLWLWAALKTAPRDRARRGRQPLAPAHPRG